MNFVAHHLANWRVGAHVRRVTIYYSNLASICNSYANVPYFCEVTFGDDSTKTASHGVLGDLPVPFQITLAPHY
jgi:hypothetical protein